MSFGFEADNDGVKEMYDAIDQVDRERERRVIFFAAASNDSSQQTDMFPARHSSVIPIHATNDQGEFIFNPSIRDHIRGTFSEGLPNNVNSAYGLSKSRVKSLTQFFFFSSIIDSYGDQTRISDHNSGWPKLFVRHSHRYQHRCNHPCTYFSPWAFVQLKQPRPFRLHRFPR